MALDGAVPCQYKGVTRVERLHLSRTVGDWARPAEFWDLQPHCSNGGQTAPWTAGNQHHGQRGGQASDSEVTLGCVLAPEKIMCLE